MLRQRLRSTLLIASALALAACSNDQHSAAPPAAAQAFPAAQVATAPAAPATTIVQAAPQSSGMQDMLTGAALGALATHALTSNDRQTAAAAPVIHRTTVVQKTVVVQKEPRSPAPALVKTAATTPAPAVKSTIPSYSPPKTATPTSYKVSYSIPKSSPAPSSRR